MKKICMQNKFTEELSPGEDLENRDHSQTEESNQCDERRARNDRIMTVQDVAELLRISRYSVYTLVNRGEMPAMMIMNKL